MLGKLLCRLGFHDFELVIDKATLKTFPRVDHYHVCRRCKLAQRAFIVG